MASVEGSIDKAIRWQVKERLEEHEHRLVDLAHQFADLRGTFREPVGYNARLLSHWIQEEPILNLFCMPQLDPYDRITDPLDTLRATKPSCMSRG